MVLKMPALRRRCCQLWHGLPAHVCADGPIPRAGNPCHHWPTSLRGGVSAFSASLRWI